MTWRSMADFLERMARARARRAAKARGSEPEGGLLARAHGASGVLLILRLLDPARLEEMLAAARAMGLFVLLETFDETDLARIAEVAVRPAPGGPALLVGLNCRDLATLRLEPERL